MMKVRTLAIAIALEVFSAGARAQFSSATPTPAKIPDVTAPSSARSFQMGTDDCATAHTNAGTGDVSGVPFTTSTTGTTGQNEANCYAFGTTGVANDVWFGWTASMTGNGTVTTCSSTALDTKIAVWPNNEPSTCPANGTSLACNDDACSHGLSTCTWSVTSGTTYTIQIGTFPGAAGGSGHFDVTQLGPPPPGQYDDGSTENAFGLTAGGEIGWIHAFDLSDGFSYTTLETAYGTLMFPGSVTNGNGSRLAVYEYHDDDGDPTTGAVPPLEVVNAVVTNGSTDLLNPVQLTKLQTRTLCFPFATKVLATADHSPGEYAGPMDQTNPTPHAWVVGSTAGPGTLDLNNLNNNSTPPMQMQSIGFPTAWLLRIPESEGVAPAQADRLLVAGSAGTVFQTDTASGQFEYFACACGGPIQALAADKERLYTADSLGQILVYDIHDGSLQAIHALAFGPITALATCGGFLFAGTGDGLVLKIDPATGAVLAFWRLPVGVGVQALLVHPRGGFLFAAGSDGAVYRAPIDGGSFTYFTCFCFFGIQDLATGGNNLVIADQFGTVAIADLTTGGLLNAFWVGSLNAMVLQDGDLLVHSGAGVIDRRSLQDGSLLPGGYTSPIGVDAMLVLPDGPSGPLRARVDPPK